MDSMHLAVPQAWGPRHQVEMEATLSPSDPPLSPRSATSQTVPAHQAARMVSLGCPGQHGGRRNSGSMGPRGERLVH